MNDKEERQRAGGKPASGSAGAAKLRDEIDRGGAGDKVAFADPAAAPLGTDDEAGGHPPTPEQVERARAQETRMTGRADVKRTPADRQGGARRFGKAAAAVALGCCVLLLVFLFF